MAGYTPPGTVEVLFHFYTIAETCRLLKIGRSSLYKRLAEGKLVARKVGGSTRFRSDELSAYMHGLTLFDGSLNGGR